jgi:hypothetical protein
MQSPPPCGALKENTDSRKKLHPYDRPASHTHYQAWQKYCSQAFAAVFKEEQRQERKLSFFWLKKKGSADTYKLSSLCQRINLFSGSRHHQKQKQEP